MSQVTAEMVKSLRERTGAGMMECKNALVASDGDTTKAIEWLRKKGVAKAASKGERTASEGLVGLGHDKALHVAAAVEVNSETDFVARNNEFANLVATAVHAVKAHSPVDVPALLQTAVDGGKKLADLFVEKVATIGENLAVRRFVHVAAGPNAVVGAYRHSDGKLAAIVELEGSRKPEAAELARELAMQVAALPVPYIDRSQVPADVLAKEKEIYRSEAAAAKRPEQMWDKIVEGKLNKYFTTVCLVDQPWIKDDTKTVQKLIDEAGKAVGTTLRIVRVERIQVGRA